MAEIKGGSSSLKINEKEGVLYLAGAIDDTSDFTLPDPGVDVITFDLRDLKTISSIGTRRWTRFMKSLGSKTVYFQACSPPFVSMLNMVPQAIGPDEDASRVKSVLVPYSCDNCDFYEEVEVLTEHLYQGDELVIPDHACSDCGGGSRLMTDIYEYFYFLIDE